VDPRQRERYIDRSVGYASLALFGVSIVVLIWFLLSGVGPAEDSGDAIGRAFAAAFGERGDARATFNALLVLAWGAVHSLTAGTAAKERLRRLLRRPHLQPAIYALIASVSLILLCLLYRPMPRLVWALAGGAALLTRLLFYAAWGLFLYCWVDLDLLEIVGLRPILRHLGGEAPPPAPFRPGGAFLWVRHPVELAFLVAFWAAPVMTAGHLLFASLLTAYTFVGVDLEDRRMLRLHGAEYGEYMKQVPQILPFPR
jgi:methanethiol S-methyltransferase